MAKKSSKKTYELKMMVPEDNKTDTEQDIMYANLPKVKKEALN